MDLADRIEEGGKIRQPCDEEAPREASKGRVENVDRIIVCGGLSAPPHSKDDQIVALDVGGAPPNANLEITNITRRLSSPSDKHAQPTFDL